MIYSPDKYRETEGIKVFKYTKNGRRDRTTNRKKPRKWAKENNSTMNRICRKFDDIGNINMNFAGVEPFNWQMLLLEPCFKTRNDIITEFCDLDNIKISLAIVNAEESPAEKDIIDNNSIIDEHITEVLSSKFGSLDVCYPYIVKFLFSDDGISKQAHKQTFWRIFGEKAVENLRENLEDYSVCSDCGMKIPHWCMTHVCQKNTQGFYECSDCGKMCVRTNSRQQRCSECQEHYRHDLKIIYRKKTQQEREERGKQFTTFLQSRSKKM